MFRMKPCRGNEEKAGAARAVAKAAAKGGEIARVIPGSPAKKVKLQPGERILEINQVRPVDLIDYLAAEASDRLHLFVAGPEGETREIRLEKAAEEPLGVVFTSAVFDRVKTCRNRCLFCFVDQMPPGLRETLYVKDDDYRLSFLQGSYITLTNLKPADWERIRRLHLSPLYISIHATEPEIRRKLFRSPAAAEIMPYLKKLAGWGVSFHGQLVLCPGINDGEVLFRTLTDLGGLWPALASLAVVPVGLTAYRRGLPELRTFAPEEAREVLAMVASFQEKFLAAYGSRLVFAADELYLLAGEEFPPLAGYEDLWQLTNGVGLWALFKAEFLRSLAGFSANCQERGYSPTGRRVVLTGFAAAKLWEELAGEVQKVFPRISLEIRPVPSAFGPEVTVAGLVTGADIIRNLREQEAAPGATILLPAVMLRREEGDFLDGYSLRQVEEAVGRRLQVVETTGEAAVRALLEGEGCQR
ncbi:MAG: DUF512 domain-containing protein [Firmicutes bacterium]|nr:DUF512 domain-containing protein [Bacillota bacterium]